MSENKDIVFKDLADSNGEFKRKVSSFRDQIKDDPDATFPAEVNRYHLYVCLICYLLTFSGVQDAHGPTEQQ
jgi:putative glutathione S-transferase